VHAIPSVHRIRQALEKIPGAIEDNPQTENTAEGSEPGTPVRRIDLTMDWSSPAPKILTPHSADEIGDQLADQPTVIFEVPASLTDAEVKEVLGNGTGDLERLAQVSGIDAYGWYVSFHQRARQHGIYIPFERLLAFALDIFAQAPMPLERKLEVAFHAILGHELFHFETDCMAANWELSNGRAVYWPGREEPWHRELEEGLANAYLLRGFRYPEGALRGTVGCYRALSDFFARQPPGYRDGPRYAKSRAGYVSGCRDLSYVLQVGGSNHQEVDPDALDTLLFYPDPFRIDWRRCPILIHDKLGLLQTLGVDVSFFEAIACITESQPFLKALAKLGATYAAKWQRRKADLARSINLNGLGFQRWKPGGSDCYSVRLDGNFRVHLRRNATKDAWIAEQIGDHKSMGHG
jgi:hypothetical protein